VRILIRTSKWAVLARRLGGLAVPLAVVPVIMHRERFLDSGLFLVVAMFAGLVAGLAVLAALVALARLWHTGDQGWGRALAGLFLGLVCLAPFGYFGSLALRFPIVTDIATAPQVLTPAEQQQYFPNATTRTYPIDPFQLYAIVAHLAEGQGWDIRQRREPGVGGEPGRLNARIVTLLGWREEVVLRVAATAEGAAVDMRSASIGAQHDLGSNGNRISDFLVALDNEVTAFLRDNPNLNQPEPVEPDVPVPEVETGNGG
jgi:hypothetical protein